MGADIINLDEAARVALNVKTEAYVRLSATDYVIIKAQERQTQLSPVWIEWREKLREVVRGNLSDIPSEPTRY
jgi:hypothetical protein